MLSKTAIQRATAVNTRAVFTKQSVRAASAWSNVPQGPPDAILGITEAFKKDSNPKKINLGVGAYRDDKGKPYVLPSVREAEQKVVKQNLDKEYAGITGVPDFTKAAALLAYGPNSAAVNENRVVITQSISGTGALRIGGAFLQRHYPGAKEIYIPTPSWANHKAVFSDCGLEVKQYRYYNKDTIGLDFDGMVADIKAMPKGSIVLLHACAHNPTGVDPTREQWHAIGDIIEQKGHFALFDCAYQGFASGDLDADAYSVRHFVSRKTIPVAICQSFAKNAGLYGERVGALHVVSATPEQNKAVLSQLSVIQRSEISNPPAFGARVVTKLLNEPELWAQWQKDVKEMAERIIDMRKSLYDLLTNKFKTPAPGGNWDHIIKQIGMFSYLGLSPQQVKRIVDEGHIYMTGNSRISMAGLNTSNVEYVAEWIDRASRDA